MKAWNTVVLDYTDWNKVIRRIYAKVAEWSLKSKHAVPAWRAMAALYGRSCEACPQWLGGKAGTDLITTLHRQYKDKAIRGVILASLRQLLVARLEQPHDDHPPGDVLPALLATVEKVLVTDKLRDGARNVVAHADLAALLGARPRLLDFTMERLVIPLLARGGEFHDLRSDSARIALGAFRQVRSSTAVN